MTRKTDTLQVTDRIALGVREVESGRFCSGGTIMNWVKGAIHSQYVGLLRAGVRVKIGNSMDLRARWPKHEGPTFVVGQPVVGTIPAAAVRLENGIFRRSKQRWNRWVGRIVLIEHLEAGILYTVKMHGEEWTVKSLGPVLGAERLSRTWDIVNVVVDPQAVELSILAPCVIVRHS